MSTFTAKSIEYMGDYMTGNLLYEIEHGDDVIEVIVKYNGNIERIANEVGATADVLSSSFAILNIAANEIENLYKYREIIYIELPKNLRIFLNSALTQSCIAYSDMNVGGLDGSGVVVGIIDSGIDKNATFYESIKYIKEFGEYQNTEHGTAVASVINKIAPQAEMAFVAIGRNDFFASDTDIMRGIKFVADSAEGRPFVVNISYGTNNGAHNGNSLFEEYIDEVAQSYRCSIVAAAGNEGDKGHHYRGNFNKSEDIEFSIEGGYGYVVLELWKDFTDIASYELISPSGDLSGIISSSVLETSFVLGDNKVYFIFSQPTPYNIQEQLYIRIEGNGTVTSGVWRLRVISGNTINGEYNIWSTQAVFLYPDVYTTVTLPATANRVITVGAYNSITNSQTAFSGRGNTADNRIKPDIAAPGVNININNTAYTGTSFSAPIAAGSCALLMQWGIVMGNDVNMYGERLKAYLRLGAIRDAGNYPNRVLGYGKLCLRNTYSKLINLSIEQTNNENPAYSENYNELVFIRSDELINTLNKNSVPYCNVDSGDYVVVYYDRNRYFESSEIKNLADKFKESTPKLLGLMDEEFNISAGISPVQRPPLDLSGRDVIVGFVDTGINYSNQEFVYEDGENKIELIWDMTDEDEVSEGVCFGRVYTNSELSAGTADTKDDTGHGTAMAIQACGRTSGAAPESAIIAVKLKRAKKFLYDFQFIPSDVPAYSSTDVILGIDFIIREANKRQKPLVLVLGLGTNEGGHNGSSTLEIYLSRLARTPGIIVVTPSGNETAARHHTSFTINNDSGYYDMELNVAENTSGFNIWLWNNILDKTEVSIISPLGEVIPRIPVQNDFSNEYSLFQTNTKVTVYYSLPAFQTSDQRTTLRFSNPLAGLWTIRVYGVTSYGSVHAWLPISGFIGSKAVFTSPDPYTTVTVPSTAENVICVGGYNPNDNSVFATSGRGPSRKSNVLPLFISPTNSATSTAASVTAGALALLSQWAVVNNNYYFLSTITASAIIINSASQNANNIYPNNIEGYGRLNLYNAFNKLI